MNQTIVEVDWYGPPWVRTYTVSNTWKLAMIAITTANSSIGRSSGIVTRRKRCKPFAPSTRAASSSSSGMLCRLARK